jgi:hypothetical protein
MTMGLLPERKINKPAVAMGFAAQVVFVVVLIQLERTSSGPHNRFASNECNWAGSQ